MGGGWKNKKLWVTLSFLLNLAILFFFKYFDFTIQNINRVLAFCHIQIIQTSFDILLPVGISFYTFQALSYTMDVYQGRVCPEKNFARYALFVSFFPQLVAGPIERSKDLLGQFHKDHSFDRERVEHGLLLMAWGFFEKLVIADRAALLVNQVYNNYQEYQGIALLIATVFFSIQIYCDFCGYSDIARGAAAVLGFQLSKNFRQPYFSRSVSEFWKRWHISLTSWFRDYVYIPMGGNRKGELRKYINIMVVFTLSGLWHGASWSFVMWGLLNGFYQLVGAVTMPVRKFIEKKIHFDTMTTERKLFQVMVTFLLINSTWIFFRAESFHHAISVYGQMFSCFNPWILFDGTLFQLGLNQREFLIVMIAIVIKIVMSLIEYFDSLHNIWDKQGTLSKGILAYVLLISVIVFGIYGAGYDEAQFIYFQF